MPPWRIRADLGVAVARSLALFMLTMATALADGASISGEVAQSRGPVSGIPILLFRRQVTSLEQVAVVSANEQGRFAFVDLPVGEYFVASARPEGGNRYQPGNSPCVVADRCLIHHGSAGIRIIASTDSVRVGLSLDMPAVVSGRVVAAENGAPIEGARISADGGLLEAHSDAEGRYRLGGFNPGRIGLRASAPGRVGRIHPDIGFDPLLPRLDVRETVLEAGENRGFDFSLGLGARLSGSVRSTISGAEVSDVVLYRTFGPQSLWRVPTTPCMHDMGGIAGGCFEIDGLFPGSFTLAAASAPTSNYVATYWLDVPCGSIGCFPGGGTPIVVKAGQTVSNLHLRVPPRRWVTGVVRDVLGGPPLAGATVLAMRSPAPGFGAYAEVDRAITDGMGRYVLDDVPAGAIDVIVSEARDRLGMRWPDEDCTTANRFCATGSGLLRVNMPAEGAVEDIDFMPRPGAQITGSVLVDGQGPVAGALVILAWPLMAGSATRTTRSDAEGRYRFAALPPYATFHVAAQHPSRPGTLFHPDQWCISGPCASLAGIPVVTPGIGTIEVDLQYPAVVLLRDGFEPAPP